MLRAQEFVLQLRHLLLGSVDYRAPAIAEPQINRSAMNLRTPAQLAIQPLPQRRGRDAEFLEQRSRHAIGLVEERCQEMFVADLLMVVLPGDILRRLQRLLHLLGEFLWSHTFSSTRQIAPAQRSSSRNQGRARSRDAAR